MSQVSDIHAALTEMALHMNILRSAKAQMPASSQAPMVMSQTELDSIVAQVQELNNQMKANFPGLPNVPPMAQGPIPPPSEIPPGMPEGPETPTENPKPPAV